MNTRRGTLTTSLWLLIWISIVLFLGCEALDAWQRSAPPVVWIVKLLPLLVLLPGAARDRLRSMLWLCFVTLLYFLTAVVRLFAEPQSPRALTELIAVVALFLCAMFYVRYRARELRAGTAEES